MDHSDPTTTTNPTGADGEENSSGVMPPHLSDDVQAELNESTVVLLDSLNETFEDEVILSKEQEEHRKREEEREEEERRREEEGRRTVARGNHYAQKSDKEKNEVADLRGQLDRGESMYREFTVMWEAKKKWLKDSISQKSQLSQNYRDIANREYAKLK